MSNIYTAITLAVRMHSGQKDKGGREYIEHPLRVMLALDTEEEKIVGVLHDIIEDTKMRIPILRAHGFSQEILDAVDAITKKPGEADKDYIMRCRENPLAKRVKLMDIRDNMSPARQYYLSINEQDRLTKKYYQSLKWLQE